MAAALLIIRLLLTGLFSLAAITKLTDRAGTRQAIVDFGVPTRLAAPISILLPLAEFAAAAALIPTASARWGALGILGLLLLFSAGIGINLARGRTPDCHCFGQLHSEPVGWVTLLRNGVLAAGASFVVWQGWDDAGLSAASWLSDMGGTERIVLFAGILGLGLAIGLSWSVLNLLRQTGRLLLRIEALEANRTPDGGQATSAVDAPLAGLPIGVTAPPFSLAALDGEMVTLDALRAAGKPVLLVFTEPECGACNALLPEIGRWQQQYGGELTIALISRGTPARNRMKRGEHAVARVLLQQGREVADAYQAHATPSAVVVTPDGVIASRVAIGAEAIGALVAEVLQQLNSLPLHLAGGGNGHLHPSENGHDTSSLPLYQVASPMGQPAPAITLPDLDGRTVDLTSFRGRRTLVLFWDPDCRFCEQMLPDLTAWELRRPKGAPELLVVSTGSVEDNRSLGLRATILRDADATAGPSFGATGTPAAVLVDAKGNIASHVALGAPDVMALAGQTGKPRATILPRPKRPST